jgi:NAD(P)-dependent dehydrogenase (short-subunit alcohol dehydrogenase family)
MSQTVLITGASSGIEATPMDVIRRQFDVNLFGEWEIPGG